MAQSSLGALLLTTNVQPEKLDALGAPLWLVGQHRSHTAAAPQSSVSPGSLSRRVPSPSAPPEHGVLVLQCPPWKKGFLSF